MSARAFLICIAAGSYALAVAIVVRRRLAAGRKPTAFTAEDFRLRRKLWARMLERRR